MKFPVILTLVVFSGYAVADIIPQGGDDYKCQTRGGFFDFSPNGAIASCREEIDRFCKTKGAPPTIGKINGEPSGPARYAKAEISFQCMTEVDIAQRQKEIATARNQQIRAEVESSKEICQKDFGFVPNTPEFSNCLLEMQKQHFANSRSAQQVAAQKEAADAQVAEMRQAESSRATMDAIQSVNKALATPRPVFVPSAPTTPSRVDTECMNYGSQTQCTSIRR